MNIDKLTADLKRDEGVRRFPYLCTQNKLTVAVGRNLSEVGLYPDEIDFLLANDISRTIHSLIGSVHFFNDLNEVRQRALVEMGFQMGINGLLKFKKMLTALSIGDYVSAEEEALNSRWSGQTPMRAARIANKLRTGEDND